MEESVVRCLPPLVRGKLTGVFEFAVEKIKITEKIFQKDDSNLVVKILWWGESKPVYVRPKQIQFITKDDNEVTIKEPGEHRVKYEVCTNIKLFKSYLEKCEVVELVILNTLRDEVVGSAFLCDLIRLIFYTQFFNTCIVNHSGDSIGEIYCHFSFKETSAEKSVQETVTNTSVSPVKKWSASDLKINLNTLNVHSSREESDRGSVLHKGNNSGRDFQDFSTFHDTIVMDGLQPETNPNLHYNSPVAQNSQPKYEPNFREPADNRSKLMNDCLKKTSSASVNSQEGIILDPSQMDSETSEKSAPINPPKVVVRVNIPFVSPKSLEVDEGEKKKIVNKSKDSHFVNKRREETLNKSRISNASAKSMNKKTVTSKVKSYIESKAQKGKNISTEGASAMSKRSVTGGSAPGNRKRGKIPNGMAKPTGNIKSITKVSKEISKLNKMYLNPVKSTDHSDLEKVPVKEVGESICGDSHIRGSTENANKKGQDNVENINAAESRGTCQSAKSDTKDQKSETFHPEKEQRKHLEEVQTDVKLRFDLSDPIEKIYYETFFGKTESRANEFEIAELLNQPENKYMLEVTQGGEFAYKDRTLPGKGNGDNERNIRLPDGDDARRDDRKSEGNLDKPKTGQGGGDRRIELSELAVTGDLRDSQLNNKTRESKIDCHRCKYYNKLSELDKIIESLRVFETRLKNDVALSSNAGVRSENVINGCPLSLPGPKPAGQAVTGDVCRRMGHDDEDPTLVLDNDGSEFSKEDSDFIEFTRYMSKR